MPLTNQQATQELFTNNYNVWKVANPPVNMSNAPHGCSEITQATANHLRGMWAPNAGPNTWNQTASTGHDAGNQITRWVTRSITGGGTVVDFHARWTSYRFLRHFKIV